MKDNRLLYICSPYHHGDIEKNIKYIKELMSEAIKYDFIPVSPHLLYSLILNNENPIEREKERNLGLKLLEHCNYIKLGDKYGITSEMKAEIKAAKEKSIIFVRI